jgi:predicted Zn-dependent protease
MTMEHCLNPGCTRHTGRGIPDDAQSQHYCPDCKALEDQLAE